jgi:hypothetical protein
MSEKITPKNLSEINLEAGTYELSATAISEGLAESDYSNEETYIREEVLSYELHPSGEYYVVTGYDESYSLNVTIPSTYNGDAGEKPVREIAPSTFAESNIEEIIIPNTIRLIGDRAFYRCTGLDKVTFNNRDSYTFYFYNKDGWEDLKFYVKRLYLIVLVPIEIPITNLGNNLFKISNVSREDIFPSMDGGAYFTGTKNGESVKTSLWKFHHGSCCQISGSKDEDGNYILELNKEYNSPELSDYCTIGTEAFAFSNLSNNWVYFSDTIGKFEKSAFESSNIRSMTFLGGTTEIGQYAFASCENLEEVELSSTIEIIGERAFYRSGNKYYLFGFRLYGSGDGVKHIRSEAFKNCSVLNFKAMLEDTYIENLFPNLETIGSQAFAFAYSDSTGGFCPVFRFPETMREVGPNVFRGCNGLSSVIFANKYGWNFYGSGGRNSFIDPSILDDPTTLAMLMTQNSANQSGTTNPELLDIFNYTWYKIFQMPTPEIEIIENHTMNIKDITGIAERFKIYARKQNSVTRVEVAIVNAVSEADFE